MGAEVLHLPTIRIAEPEDRTPLLAAVREVDRFDWIVFTSVNGVSRFWTALREVGRSHLRQGVSICAVGPATAAAVELEGGRADLLPERYVAESVVEALTRDAAAEGVRVLLPRALEARAVLPDALRAAGAEVQEVIAYRTLPESIEGDTLREEFASGMVDLVTFTSASAVRNLVALLGSDLGRTRIASIGPITSGAARELGMSVHIEAAEYTVSDLLHAIREQYATCHP
ncbi:MAG: uroporphyrinogen-III synthase [Gemmatimonadota bacterium]|nr:uroporphyrinogen-III synthase [Gemmatimonadota bacterium]